MKQRGNNYFAFFGGYFSNWSPMMFQVEGVEYNCGEQYFMAKKAEFFNDEEAYNAIMDTNNPRIQKQWGRKVKNYDQDRWNEVSRKIMYEGTLARFYQNQEPKEVLLATGGLELVEASPTDLVWGIGLSVSHKDVEDKSKWRGTNWLGEVLMLVREELRNK